MAAVAREKAPRAQRRRLPRRHRQRHGNRRVRYVMVRHVAVGPVVELEHRAVHDHGPPAALTASEKPTTLPPAFLTAASASFLSRNGSMVDLSPSPDTAKKAWSANSLMPRALSKR